MENILKVVLESRAILKMEKNQICSQFVTVLTYQDFNARMKNKIKKLSSFWDLAVWNQTFFWSEMCLSFKKKERGEE